MLHNANNHMRYQEVFGMFFVIVYDIRVKMSYVVLLT